MPRPRLKQNVGGIRVPPGRTARRSGFGETRCAGAWDASRSKSALASASASPRTESGTQPLRRWDGGRVTFGDENGGGVLPHCRARTPTRSARSGRTTWRPALSPVTTRPCGPRPECARCTLQLRPGHRPRHPGLVGVHGRDHRHPPNPVEIGYYKAGDPIAANTWSTYWHNGFVYANDITRGFDVFSLAHPAVAGAVLLERDNPQTEERLVPWAGDSRRVAASAAVPAGRAEPPRDQSVGYRPRTRSALDKP